MKLSLCSIDYREEEEKPVLYLFCRDDKYNRYEIPIRDFKPYFYIKKSHYFGVKPHLKRWKNQIDYISTKPLLYDSSKIKIFTKLPRFVRDIRVWLSSYELVKLIGFRIKSYEADILFPLRFLIDKGIFNGIDYNPVTKEYKPIDMESKIRFLCIDIEVNMDEIKDNKDAEGELIVVGLYDSLTDKYYIYTSKYNKKLQSKLVKYLLQKGKEIEFIKCKDESDLMIKSIEFMIKVKPDIVMSFSPFDMAYIIYRARKIDINIRKLSPLNIVRIFKDEKVRISGIQVLDIAEMYRETLRTSKWETLEEVAQKELGVGRVFHDELVYDNWNSKNDWWKVIARNMRDIELIKMLNEELELLEHFDTIRRTVGCNFRDTFYASRIADVMFLREVDGKDILPSRSIYEKYKYPGAKVFKCDKGIHKNIAIFDFKEMYPVFIDIFNISYETFRAFPSDNTVKVYDGHYFVKNPKGCTVNIMDRIRPIRERLKQHMKKLSPLVREYKRLKSRSDGYKSVINAVYGFYGFGGDIDKGIPSSRLYAPLIAESVTYPGRTILEMLKEYIPKINYDIVYGDTDSIFIKLKTKNLEKEAKELQKKLSKKIKQFIIETWDVDSEELKLEVDKIATKIILFTKKRYVLKTIEGDIDRKGIEAIRRESSKTTIELQRNITNMILEDKTKEDIEKYLTKELREFRHKPLEEIALSPKLSKAEDMYPVFAIHLQAFMYSKYNLNIDLKIGSRFYMIYINKLPDKYPRYISRVYKKKLKRKKAKVIAFKDPSQIPNGFKVDYEVMIEKTIRKKIDDLLNVLDINWNKIYSPFKPQKELFNFHNRM